MPDLIFVPTVLVHHLVGWMPLIKRKLRKLPCRVLLFFPNAPVDLRNDGTAHLLPDPTAKLFRVCIRSLAKQVASGKVILGAETKPMTKALSEVTGVPFTYLPHPVELAASQSLAIGRPRPVTPEKPILFGCYGAARYEKGSDVLQAAIRLVLEGGAKPPVKIALQWLDEFTDAHGNLVKLDPWLKAHPTVDVIESYFGEGGYAVQLAATDVMVLPYRSPYRLRVSRVLVEAMLLGMPVIATRGTTLAEQAGEFGAMIPCTDGSAESLAAAINEAVESLPSLLATSQARRHAATRHFSVQHFRELLLG
jgi:glycosyltransferase involved in cell wall biosynthesis